MSGTVDVAELAGGLRTVVNRLAYALRAPLARQGVTPTRLTAMVVLDKSGPLRAGDLAAVLNISAASMSRLSEVLEEGGWIAREPDPADRRACLLSLSDRGTAALEQLRRESTGELADAIAALDGDQRARLESALPALIALADRLMGADLAIKPTLRERRDGAPAPRLQSSRAQGGTCDAGPTTV